MSQENVEQARRAYEAFGRGDIQAVLENYTPETEWHSQSGSRWIGGVFRGPQAILQEVFMRIGEFWDNFSVETREFLDAGDRVIVLGTVRATAKSTGKAVETPFVHIAQYRDGKVIRFETYEDTATVNEVLGR